MCKVDVSALLSDDEETFKKAVKYFAESDLPNGYFLQFVTCKTKEYAEKYGEIKTNNIKSGRFLTESFAEVLVARGIDKLQDVADDMFLWFEDINGIGNGVIGRFLEANSTDSGFKEAAKRAVIREYHKNSNLQEELVIFEALSIFYGDKKLVQEMIKDYYNDVNLFKKYSLEEVLQAIES